MAGAGAPPGLTDPQLDKLLASISQADLDAAEEMARFLAEPAAGRNRQGQSRPSTPAKPAGS